MEQIKIKNTKDTKYDEAKFKMFASMQECLDKNKDKHMFYVKVPYTTDLYRMFIANLPTGDLRAKWRCNACRSFINKYGRLVVVTPTGELKSALFDFDAEFPFSVSIAAIRECVCNGKILSEFITSNTCIGNSEDDVDNDFYHFRAYINSEDYACFCKGKDPSDRIYRVSEGVKMVTHAITTRNKETVKLMLNFVETMDYRAEKFKAPAIWFYNLYNHFYETDSKLRMNIVWKAVSESAEGFWHINGSVIGNIMDMIDKGFDYDYIQENINDVLDPLKYQRGATINEGSVKEANNLIEKLGLLDSLKRRYAIISEIPKMWIPKVEENTPSKGLFDSLLKDDKKLRFKGVNRIPKQISFSQFEEKILPKAISIKYVCNEYDNPVYIVTEAIPGSKPILKWDKEDQRNPYSWFFKSGYNLKMCNIATDVINVVGICKIPSMFYSDKFRQWGNHHILLLEGMRPLEVGYALFPEILIDDLFPIRNVINKWSDEQTMEIPDGQIASGIMIDQLGSMKTNPIVEVETLIGFARYKLYEDIDL